MPAATSERRPTRDHLHEVFPLLRKDVLKNGPGVYTGKLYSPLCSLRWKSSRDDVLVGLGPFDRARFLASLAPNVHLVASPSPCPTTTPQRPSTRTARPLPPPPCPLRSSSTSTGPPPRSSPSPQPRPFPLAPRSRSPWLRPLLLRLVGVRRATPSRPSCVLLIRLALCVARSLNALASACDQVLKQGGAYSASVVVEWTTKVRVCGLTHSKQRAD